MKAGEMRGKRMSCTSCILLEKTLADGVSVFYSRRFVDKILVGLNSQLITAFIFRVSGMTSHQFETELVFLGKLVQLFPKFYILDRLQTTLGLSFPSSPFPVFHPFRDALFDVGTVRHNMDASRSFQIPESLNDRLKFHLVVGRFGPCPTFFHGLAGWGVAQDEGPTARPRVSAAGPICIKRNLCIEGGVHVRLVHYSHDINW